MASMNPRDQGKQYFQKGKYSAAAESFTEAITLEPTIAALYQNRALCYQKLGRWEDVLGDAERALKILQSAGSGTGKALYLQGTAFLNLNRLDEAEQSFMNAMSHTSSPEFSSYRPSIEKGLYTVYTQKFEAEQTRLEFEDGSNKAILEQLAREAAQLDEDSSAAAQRLITFEILKDPVLTPSGQTFERDAIECHLSQVIEDFLKKNPWAFSQ